MWIVIRVSTMWPMMITDMSINVVTRSFCMRAGGVYFDANYFAIFIQNGFNMLAKWVCEMIIDWVINFYYLSEKTFYLKNDLVEKILSIKTIFV